MAHIASCMVDADGTHGTLKGYIAKSLSPQTSSDSLDKISVSSTDDKRPFAWRMHQAETRKYQLFPKEKQLPPLHTVKQTDGELAAATAAPQAEKLDKAEKTNGLRLRIKEHNLIRRRKVSVPELGPMTTVQEVAMDSPTIPGRPALHERSISTPVTSFRQHRHADSNVSNLEFVSEPSPLSTITSPNDIEEVKVSPITRHQSSPRDLAPLIIPGHHSTTASSARHVAYSHSRSGSTPIDTNGRSSSRLDESPRSRTPYSVFTPPSASTYTMTPRSALASATIPTPSSAPFESRGSPISATPQRSAVELTSPPLADLPPRAATAMSHRRNQSESGSIMERGRPRKRSDGTPVGFAGPAAGAVGGLKRATSKRSKSAERRAFETLPHGLKPLNVEKGMEADELLYLKKQAIGQALRFEVLKREDVESLSKELRHLDERSDYLRKTYNSLRAGRRNLHSRICHYLRSPRTAKFSHDSMLKQEEALADLDASIDDWVTKLEQAENRRTRVRQKLLEHVAAAAMMPTTTDVAGASESLQHAMGVRAPNAASDMSTPPRSPTKISPPLRSLSPSTSPQRVVGRVPSVIDEVPGEEAATMGLGLEPKGQDDRQSTIQRMESIRIYADSEVYALLADVESEFTKLSVDDNDVLSLDAALSDNRRRTSTDGSIQGSDDKRRELHRARSHELLSATITNVHEIPALTFAEKSVPVSPPAPLPPSKNSPPLSANDNLILTAAVFQPTRA